MTRKGQSDRARMRRRVRTFATTIAELLRDSKAIVTGAHDETWNMAIEYAARLIEQRGKGGV